MQSVADQEVQPCAIVIPVYLPQLEKFDQFSLDYSVAVLKGRFLCFIAPEGMDTAYYHARYPDIPFEFFDKELFASIPGYNRLMLGMPLHERFAGHEFLLILQADAIVLRDELDYWCAQPFDYVGAPWPEQYELFVNLDRFEGGYGKHMKVAVGNGGLSLRRIRKCVALLEEFPSASNVFRHTGSSEDLFYSVMGNLSVDFIIPNEITASRFSMELKPSFYYHVNGGKLPMGTHAWWKYEPEFWRQHIPGMPAL
ncbi:MAG: hypothetical protein A3F78_09765 [Burkholderiales bacterium RIFCSPLOWO2_12_FULL_61_40]|nr:MAG: hypothetical protein A3F78_09765 [Burkholderiales bacterium RIFCSPLOWO2_12_FULL_61_40]